MFVEPLECDVVMYCLAIIILGKEPMRPDACNCIWRPSQYVLDPPCQEVVLDTANPEELKKKVPSIHYKHKSSCISKTLFN